KKWKILIIIFIQILFQPFTKSELAIITIPNLFSSLGCKSLLYVIIGILGTLLISGILYCSSTLAGTCILLFFFAFSKSFLNCINFSFPNFSLLFLILCSSISDSILPCFLLGIPIIHTYG